MDKIIDIFFKEKPALVLLALNKNSDTEKTVSCLAKDANCVFAHVTNILKAFGSEKITTFKKEGRNKIISLTEKGKQLAALLEQMVNVERSIKTSETEVKGGDDK